MKGENNVSKLTIDEKTIALYMKKNKCSRDDAIELIQYDIDVDDNKPTAYDLTAEQKNVVKAMMRNVAEIAAFLREDAQRQAFVDVIISNVSRQITFSIGEKKFEINLIEKRPPKT